MNFAHAFPRTIRRHAVATAVACCFAPAVAWANPVGPVVTHGQASFNAQGKVLTVTNSPGSIINWQGFSIGVGETTRFIQQNAASAVLNRVVSGEASSILGALQSNGRVFLVNPNGIIFGAGAHIDTAGLVASTLNIMDADFLTGKLRFGPTPDAKSITNAGEIVTPAGGRVMLIAPEGVTNTGIINTPKGEVILAAGETVELTDTANPEVRYEVTAPEAKAVNLGKIVAEAGKIGIYGSIAANRGVVSANTAVVGENGKIVFRAVNEASLEAGSVTTANGPEGGSIEVSSGGTTLVAGDVQANGATGKGGEVKVLGERVGLVGSGRIDVSGDQGGGTVLVGGDLQGANPAVQNAKQTYVGGDAEIRADALSNGDGGKVIVWADDTTRSHGSISARGGAASGDGGFVETSGKRGLEVTRGPDVRAPAGNSGTWLLDPVDLTVVAGGTFDINTNSGAPFFAPLTEGSTIGVDLINAQLDFGSNVILTTTSRGATAGTDPGNITIAAPIVKSASTQPGGPFIGTTSLTLQAHNDVVISAGGSISSTGDPLNVVLTANTDNTGGGSITVGGAVTTRGGQFSATGADTVAVNAAINTTNATGTSGGTVQLNSTAGTVSVAAPISSGFFSASGQAGVTIAAPVTGTSSMSLNSSAGTVTVASNLTSPSSISITGRNGISVASSGQIATGQFSSFSGTVNDPSSASIFSIAPGGQISTASVTLTTDNADIQGTIALNANGGNVTLRQNTFGRAINVGTEVGTALSLTQAELDHITGMTSLSLGNTSSGAITVAGPVTLATSFASFNSSQSIVLNAGTTSVGQMSFSAPTVTVGAPLSSTGSSLAFTTDNFNVNSTATSSSNIDINARSFGRAVSLGVGTPTGNAIELTSSQLNNLVTSNRVRFNTAGPINITGAIAPTGTSSLNLTSTSNAITQSAGSSITVPNLSLSARTGIDLREDNDVGLLAAQIFCCSAGNIDFTNKANATLGIGTVDGVTGVTINNFSGTGNITLQADDMNIAASVRTNTGDIKLLPRQASTTVTLGADAASTLGLTAAELGSVQATGLTIAGDRMDIAGPVTFFPTKTTLAPVSPNRPVSIVSAKANPTALEFLPAEFANLSGGTIVIGGAGAGPVSVTVPATVPGSIGTFGLHSADSTSGITIAPGAGIAASNTVRLTADVLTVDSNVSSTSGSIIIEPHTGSRNLTIGTDPGGTLGIDTNELARLSAPAGSIQFMTPSGSINVTDVTTFAGGSASSVTMEAGSTITVEVESGLFTPGALSLRAATLVIDESVSATTGDITLVGNSMTIDAPVTATAGNIKASPRDSRSIDLGGAGSGSTLGLAQPELSNLNASGYVRIGDIDGFTGNIHISTALTLPANRTLSLKTANGDVTQAAPLVIPNGSLAVEASDLVSLVQPNQVANVALSSWNDNVSFVRAPGAALTVTQVDDVAGANAGFGLGALTITADRIDINTANTGVSLRGDTVTLVPSAGGLIDIGSKPGGGGFGLVQGEFDRVFANVFAVGNSSAGNITVSQPVASTSPTDLSLVTGSGGTITVNPGANLSSRGNLALTGGTINTSATLGSTNTGVNLNANSITLGDTVSAGGGLIRIAPLTAGTMVAVGGADVVSTISTLGLDATDLGHLSYGTGSLSIGSTTAGDMTVSHVGTLPGSVTLESGGHTTFSASSFGAGAHLGITANSMSIPGNTVTAGAGMTIQPATAGRAITLGSKPATGLELDFAELAKLAVASGALRFDTSGTLTTTAPIAYTGGPDIALSAGTINLSGGLLSAPGGIELRGDSISAGGFGGLQSTGGGRVVIAPRTMRSMALGTQPGGSTLGLLSAQIGSITTSGVVQFGDAATTSSLQITAPLVQPAGSSALALFASSSISQTPGSPITAGNLRVESTGSSINLSEANSIGTIAGSSASSFSVTSTGNLTVGAVDGVEGITDTNVTLRSDSLDIVKDIIGNTVTLAPRVAGAAVDLGTDGGFGLTNDEINRVSASTLVVGTSGTNPTGAITVSAPIAYVNGSNLNLQTGAGGTINVNAGVGSSNSGNVSMTATTGSLNVNAPILTSGNVSLTADAIASSAAITSENSSATLFAGTNGTVTVGGALNGFFGVQVTGKTIVVNAPVTASYDFSSITLAAASGAVGSSVTINNQLTAGSSISITTDAIAINAPLVTLNSSMTLQPRTAGTPISLGTETSGAFSLTDAELALLQVENLTIGNSSAGPLSINAPISSSTLQQLNLRSGGDITQSTAAPITLTYALTNPETGYVQPLAGLNVVSSSGKVDLPADNNINNSVTGQAGGSLQNFVFKNTSPLKLQNVSTEIGFAPTGKTLFNSPPGSFVPLLGGESVTEQQAVDAAIAALLKAEDTQKDADDDSEAKKSEDEKKAREEEKKEGKKSCS